MGGVRERGRPIWEGSAERSDAGGGQPSHSLAPSSCAPPVLALDRGGRLLFEHVVHIPPPSQPVSVDGKYQVVRLLGVGGMGAVYEARHLGTGRRVAVKVIAGDVSVSDPDILRRFQREAMATGAVETQHIAHVLDAGIDGETGSPYMVLE